MNDICYGCRSRAVGCSKFCEKRKGSFMELIRIVHIKNNAERSLRSIKKGAINNAKK